MPVKLAPSRFSFRSSLLMLVLCAPGIAPAKVQTAGSSEFVRHQVTCESPVRLTQDCSAWSGATRAIAFDRFRMALAADDDGRTILLTRVHLQPNHNGAAFTGRSLHNAQVRMQHAVDALRSAMQQRGICLERVQPVNDGAKVHAYFLSFSDNVYRYLKQFTVLDSHDLSPRQQAAR